MIYLSYQSTSASFNRSGKTGAGENSLLHDPQREHLPCTHMLARPTQCRFDTFFSVVRNSTGIIDRSRKHRSSYLQLVVIMLCCQSTRTGFQVFELRRVFRLR